MKRIFAMAIALFGPGRMRTDRAPDSLSLPQEYAAFCPAGGIYELPGCLYQTGRIPVAHTGRKR